MKYIVSNFYHFIGLCEEGRSEVLRKSHSYAKSLINPSAENNKQY